MDLFQLWDDDFPLSKNFSRRELNKFMKTITDLPEHIKEDMYNKLLNRAVKNELENIVTIVQRIIITVSYQVSTLNLEMLHSSIYEAIEQYKEPDAEYSVNYLNDIFGTKRIQIIQRIPGHRLMVDSISLSSCLR